MIEKINSIKFENFINKKISRFISFCFTDKQNLLIKQNNLKSPTVLCIK